MRRANEWLRHNPHVRAQTCESIELKKRTGENNVDTEKVTFYEYGEYHNKFVRALRYHEIHCLHFNVYERSNLNVEQLWQNSVQNL